MSEMDVNFCCVARRTLGSMDVNKLRISWEQIIAYVCVS